MIAIETARLSVAFTSGLIAAVNPCGFVLLPTYLIYFMGMENLRPGAQRGSVTRALAVGGAVSAGFVSVFMVIGAISKLGFSWIDSNSGWLGLGVGLALVALGVAMIFGYRLPFTTPKLDIGERDRSVRSMFIFGIAYAVASISCTIGPVLGVLGGFSTGGFATGMLAMAMYGLGTALVITALTVTLALANTGLLRVLRRGMAWFEYLAGIFVLLTGLYLAWYGYTQISQNYDDEITASATTRSERISAWMQDNQTAVVVVLSTVLGGAILWATALAVQRRLPRSTPAPSE